MPELGAIGRGEDMEITTYLESAMTSELQGNVVDLCPVGALTSKPYAFAARPWELNKTESIDVMDALGSAIRIDTRGREVMRILPRVNDDVNEEWISDKTRHVVDGLRTPAARPALHPRERPAAAGVLAGGVRGDRRQGRRRRAPERIGAIVGDLAAVEEMFALKDLMTRLGVGNLDCRQDGAALDPKWGRASYLFNATIAGIEQADALLIVGANPRKEAAVLNARIRKRWRAGNFPIGLIGEQADLTYPLRLSRRRAGDARRARGRPWRFAETLQKAERPLVMLGRARWRAATARRSPRWPPRRRQSSARSRTAGTASRSCTPRPSRVGALDLGFVPGEGGLKAAQMADAGALDVAVPARRRRDRHRARRLRRLHRHPRRPRRAPRRRHPAGRGLSGEIRHLRQHRGPRADGGARRVPARRRARGLGDPARAVGRAGPQAALRLARATARRRCSRRIRICSASARSRRATARRHRDARRRSAARRTRRRSARPIDDFYLTNPIARASAVMAECSAIAEGQRALSAAE